MSSLRTMYDKNKKYNKPSPAKKSFRKRKRLSHPIKNYIFGKRMSLFIPCSMSVEAALLIPLFMFFFLHLSGVIEMLRLHGKVQAALWNVGNRTVIYTETFAEEMGELSHDAVSYLVIRDQMISYLDRKYLEESPLVYGKDGLNYLRSEYLDDQDCVDIVVTYQVEPILSLFPIPYRRMYNRYYGRAWTGYDVGLENSAKQYVYITEQGEVWHTTPYCSYLYHEILMVKARDIAEQKNARGKKYILCEFCQDEQQGTYVYYTAEGERYHLKRKCTAIYKDIRAIVWQEDLPYRKCSRCEE